LRLIKPIFGKRRIIIQKASLKRVLSVLSLYSIGYGNVGSSIYYALGITAFYALGATPLALLIAGVIFLFTALTYSEGVGLMPEAGGSSSFARKGFNELISFICAWILMLSYVVTISISAATVPFYLANLSCWFKIPQIATATSIGIILALAIINIIGVKEASKVNITFCILDLSTQFILVTLGIIFLLNFPKLISYIDFSGKSGTWPSIDKLILGSSIAMVAYIGLESVAQMAEETKMPGKNIPKSLLLTVITVLFMYAGISLIALSAMEPKVLVKDWGNDPIAGIAYHLPKFFASFMLPWVGILAATILIIASNAGILGVSRLAFSMGRYKQIPSIFLKLTKKSDTPYISISFFSIIAILLVIPGFFTTELLLKLGELYVFSATAAFALAHISIIALRYKEKKERVYKAWWNIKIGNTEVSLTSILGFIFCALAFLIVCAVREFGRNIGILWLIFGIFIYVYYRLKNKLPILKTSGVLAPTKVFFEKTPIKTILVPTAGTPFCEEMIEAACKFKKAEAKLIVEVISIVEVPMVLGLNEPQEEDLQKAQEALQRAKYIADEYKVKITTKLITARHAGKTIIDEAKNIKADLILLGASGKLRAEDEYFGKTTEYVIKHAPCRVWTSMVATTS
jgi:APA family basic amino acid/polyamine antiporter